MQKLKELISSLEATQVEKLIISNKRSSQQEIQKVIIKPIKFKNQIGYQLESFTKTQAFHKNINEVELLDELLNCLESFKQIDGYTSSEHFVVKANKLSKIHVISKAIEKKELKVISHNRKKQYILDEGMNIPVFYDLGIFTKEGKVAHSHYDKFKQINRFIEMIDDALKQDNSIKRIVDFGCGKSYLTFILYYYLHEIRNLDVEIIGLDLKVDVIKECEQLALKYGYHNLKFQIGDIKDYQTSNQVDMVISLHACNTATDYALYNALKWNAKYIFSVPCCQHEINKHLKADPTEIFNHYGLIQERFSALMSDSLRGLVLESFGYQVNLLEFVDLSHSPKNILIRGIRTNKGFDQAKLDIVTNGVNTYQTKFTLLELIADIER